MPYSYPSQINVQHYFQTVPMTHLNLFHTGNLLSAVGLDIEDRCLTDEDSSGVAGEWVYLGLHEF
jgi:hypothetical protein